MTGSAARGSGGGAWAARRQRGLVSAGGSEEIRRDRAGTAGLAATAASIVLTFTVGVLGPSVMEPQLPGGAGQPPWAFTDRPSPYLVVALTAIAIATGTAGLAMCLRAARRGWSASPKMILTAGILCAAALALVPPFGSSDHLSYAAYGRMVITGHNPYTTTPAALARLGDPIARAVQDWRYSPSDYGSLATGGQALASLIGGTSVRLTVFVLSLLNVAAFAVTGLLLHWLARGDRGRQLRAGLLFVFNPLLLQVLVAGAHVDSQAIVFGVGALAAFSLGSADGPRRAGPVCQVMAAAAAGGLIGLGFAVKVAMVLIGAGLAASCVLAWRARTRARTPGGAPPSDRPRGSRDLALGLGGLAGGFCVTAGASLVRWGPGSLTPALRAGSYVSIGSPWRAVRAALSLVTGEGLAEDLVKAAAVAGALALLALLLRSISTAAPGSWPQVGDLAGRATGPVARSTTGNPGGSAIVAPGAGAMGWLAAAVTFATVFAWLVAWPYVLPWYDSLGWALLALLPFSRLDWLMLARTAALAFGYLPARGIVMPAGLGWLETVVRAGATPLILLTVTVALVVMLWPRRGAPLAGVAPVGAGRPDGAGRSREGRLTS